MKSNTRPLHALIAVLGFNSMSITASGADVPITSRPQIARSVEPLHGSLEIYDVQSNQLDSLKQQYRRVAQELRTMQLRYNGRHPKVVLIQNQLDVLKKEIATTRKALSRTTDSLTDEEQAFAYERYKAKIELEVQKMRVQLAELQTRYKPKFPRVIEAKAKLDTLEQTLAHINERHRADFPNLSSGLERLQLETALVQKKGELNQLQRRYRDKHPLIIDAKQQIQILEDELELLPEPQTPPITQNREAAKKSLLREEIALIEDHLKRSNESNIEKERERTQTRLELLQLKQQLATLEGRPSDRRQLLGQQKELLEKILATTHSEEEAFRIKRQIIAIKRDQLELQ